MPGHATKKGVPRKALPSHVGLASLISLRSGAWRRPVPRPSSWECQWSSRRFRPWPKFSRARCCRAAAGSAGTAYRRIRGAGRYLCASCPPPSLRISSVLVDVDFEILTGHARSSDLHLVLVFVFDDVDGRSRGVAAFGEPVVIQKFVENARQPVLIRSCRCHNLVLLVLFWFNFIFFRSPFRSGFIRNRSNPVPAA